MVFNSLVFLVFLGIVLILYFRLNFRGQNWMLIGASYLFYGWWDYRFLALLLFTTFFDYYCALLIDRESEPRRRKLLLASSMTVNLGVLCTFKYFNFFMDSLQGAMATVGVSMSFPMLHVVLPVGISFYTFLSMSYTIDVYRRELKATHHPTDFMLYVAFFPHLVAGPIVRASILLPQCQKPRRIIPEEVANGLWLILMGFVKKVVIADRLAQVVNWGFAGGVPPFADANSWLIIYAFAFQIYGDFSGYSDIARGVSKLMGFELVENFRAPYLVTNASSFWRHWHISLSTWLRDYLYIPLGGNRHGHYKTYRNLMITMLLGGLWHGAGAAYVLWGLYHGLLLAVQRAWGSVMEKVHGSRSPISAKIMSAQEGARVHPRLERELVPAGMRAAEGAYDGETLQSAPMRESVATISEVVANPLRAPLTVFAAVKNAVFIILFFHLTCLGWLLFRAGALPHGVNQVKCVVDFLRTMVVWPSTFSPMAQGVLGICMAALFFQWKYDAMNRFSKWSPAWKGVGVIAAIAAIASLGVFEGSQFIYFQF
jgi:D-alanyl-lipoteichoic acid acyltransferase DltB (MBOAT superfamily)